MDKKTEKSQAEKLEEKLISNHKNGGLILSDDKLKKADNFPMATKLFSIKPKQNVKLYQKR